MAARSEPLRTRQASLAELVCTARKAGWLLVELRWLQVAILYGARHPNILLLVTHVALVQPAVDVSVW